MKIWSQFLILPIFICQFLYAISAFAQGEEKPVSLDNLGDNSINLNNVISALDSAKGIEDRAHEMLIRGFVVASYRYNANGVAGGTGNDDTFGQDLPDTKSFGVNDMDLAITKRFSQYFWASGEIELTEAINNDNRTESTRTELHTAEIHLVAPYGNGVDFALGRFHSPVSFENMHAPLMFQTSHSLTYQYASPAHITGARIHYPIMENLDVTAFVSNSGWAAANVTQNNAQNMTLNLGYAPLRWVDTKISYLYTHPFTNLNNVRQVGDFTAMMTPFKGWIFGGEIAYGTDQGMSTINPGKDASWWSGQATAHYDFTKTYGLTGRYSFLNDRGGRQDITPTQPRNMHEVTIAPIVHLVPGAIGLLGQGTIPGTKHEVLGIDLRLEYRYDWIAEALGPNSYFIDRFGNAKSNRNMFVAELVASF